MRKIFLVGISGSGKSSVGRIVADRLGIPFIDIDALIEETCGESIASIFARYGEDYFRSCESRVLAQVAQAGDPAIIATGGGIVIRPENRLLMRESGLCIYLSVDPETALERLHAQHTRALASGDSPEVRPLLAGPDPLTALQNLLQARAGWYEEADYTCSTHNKSPEQVAREIIALLLASGQLPSDPSLTFVKPVQVADSSYNIIVDWGGLGRLAEHLKSLNLHPRVFLISDTNVASLYGPVVCTALEAAGFQPLLYTVPAGEASKSQQQLYAIYDWLVEQHAERREAIIALGGGMIGDLAGYAAATYQRGVPLVQVPTSLLAQVDAAIGGKTAINHPKGKNIIGAFYHPRLVLVDPATLLTLPAREWTEGWAEVVKYGMILDATLFARLEAHAGVLGSPAHPPAALLCQIIARCIDLKIGVIQQDEREQGLRAILNYGHTIAHALENVSGYGELLHGEAVSLGMVVAASIAQKAGMFSEAGAARQQKLLEALGLPTFYSGSARPGDILVAIQHDKKVANQQVRWVMPRSIGEVKITAMPADLVESTITAFFAKETR